MEQYYIVATLARRPSAKESTEAMVSGGMMYAGRIKAVISADTWQEAMDAGKEMIAGCLKKGVTPTQWLWMSVKDAEAMGDAGIYEQYNTATWLCYYRVKAGLTQQQLAAASDVNVRQIQRVESGASSAGNLTARNLLAIADALGVDPHDLI